MSETRPTEPKKNPQGKVAVLLGIISIILAAALVATFAYYIPKINDLEKKIDNITEAVNPSNFTSEYTRILLPALNQSIAQGQQGSVSFLFNKIEYKFYYAMPSGSTTFKGFIFVIQVAAGSFPQASYFNAVVNAEHEFYGIVVKVSEVHSDYIVLLAKSL